MLLAVFCVGFIDQPDQAVKHLQLRDRNPGTLRGPDGLLAAVRERADRGPCSFTLLVPQLIAEEAFGDIELVRLAFTVFGD